MLTVVITGSFLLLVALQGATSEQCAQQLDEPGIAFCNESRIILNIAKVFTYPVTGIDSERKLLYKYDPINGLACDPAGSTAPRSAICQLANSSSDLGTSSASILFVSWDLLNTGPYTFTVSYFLGDYNTARHMYRSATIHFIEDDTFDSNTPEFVVIGETTPLHYEFEVRGKYVGQPNTTHKGNW